MHRANRQIELCERQSSVRPQHSALPLILFVFIHDFASLTQFTHSFHFHAYLMSRSPICYFN